MQQIVKNGQNTFQIVLLILKQISLCFLVKIPSFSLAGHKQQPDHRLN